MLIFETGPVHLIEQLLTIRRSTLLLVTAGVLAYGALELTEAVGLWLMRRWGEYVAVVGTAVFIPLEVHELLAKVTWLRTAALVINLFAIAYLLWTKRLFGLRGGHAAFLAGRQAESLIEVEQAAAASAPLVGDVVAAAARRADPSPCAPAPPRGSAGSPARAP